MQWSRGVFNWAKIDNCKFGMEKFQLLDASKKLIPNPLNPRRRIPQPQQTLTLGKQHIPLKETAQFLGVLVDNKLNWKVQCAATLAKGQDWLIQFRGLACASHGINTKYIWQLYLSIAVPHMLYTTGIFLTPQQNIGKRAKNSHNKQAAINKLASIQRRAAIMITGAMKTMAMDILEVMENLLPFHLLVNKHHHCAAICLATLPNSHPLHKPVANAAESRQISQTINTVCFNTRWKPGITTEVITRTDKAIETIQNDNPDVKVFKGGSGMDGKIGATAILYRNGRLKTKLQHQLGP